jgi:hypothetical protein
MKEKHKKIQAQVLAPQSQETKETSKVSSLFFKRASAPKAPTEEPPNVVM